MLTYSEIRSFICFAKSPCNLHGDVGTGGTQPAAEGSNDIACLSTAPKITAMTVTCTTDSGWECTLGCRVLARRDMMWQQHSEEGVPPRHSGRDGMQRMSWGPTDPGGSLWSLAPTTPGYRQRRVAIFTRSDDSGLEAQALDGLGLSRI